MPTFTDGVGVIPSAWLNPVDVTVNTVLGAPTTQAQLLANLNAALSVYFASLPTTLPGTAGKLWLNGKTVCIS
jgi:hypothetical protein